MQRPNSGGRESRPKTNTKALQRAMKYLGPYKLLSVGAFISLIISQGMNLLTPQLLRRVIDDGVTPKNLGVIEVMGIALIALAIIKGVFTFAQSYLAEKLSQNVAYDLRNLIFNKITTLSFSYHDQQQTGQLMTRVTSDVELVRQFLGMALLQLIGSIIVVVGVVVALVRINWQLALVELAALPLIMVILVYFLSKVRPLFGVVQGKLSALNTILQENLAGMRVVRAFAREPYEYERYTKINTELKDINLTVNRASAGTFPLLFTVVSLALTAVTLAGGLQVIGGQLTVGELVAFSTYLAVLIMPMFAFGFLSAFVSRASVSAERIFEVLDAESEVKDKPGAISLPLVNGKVEFRNVSFKFAGAERWTLDNVNFVVQPNSKVAIVGRTGSGKSSITNLIPRFYDPQKGEVLIDDHNIKDVTLDSLRGDIGIVLQDTILFSGTIKENIAYGKPDATDEEVVSAAKAAQAHDFITEIPEGYAAQIGERGVGLSGGQKQRLAIARALLLKPRLVIFDDSTSAVDAQTEYLIQKALQDMLNAFSCTSFVIAQRFSSVRNADLILLVDNGKIVAQGSHEELLRDSALYGEILDTQFAPERQVDSESKFIAEK